MRGGAIGVVATVDGSEKVEVVFETTKWSFCNCATCSGES
eukprot:CAMPEP_0197185352 /NCGR_PEP_ID=MMETSP1423-20130617/11790_1 /TAXON_ID=476441 /ORGANISM="Pseudo-nitzschia heimii, Strain UNC1101" /LENGTH=39 /DNA_ID= /DNA_START= /DNA_END= /DNA_ORIENTATION=